MEKLKFNIGNKIIGDNNVLIQTMSDSKTSNVDYNIKLTNELEKIGLDMMRFSILDNDDVEAIKIIKKNTNIPIIADIHFNYKFALAVMDNNIDKVRINPGNIGSEVFLREIINKAKSKNVTLRIGVNSGSLNKYKGKTKSPIDDYLLALDETLNIFESEGFNHIVLSLKSTSIDYTTKLYKKAYLKYPYPLHLGLTEAGRNTQGIVKSSICLFPLLQEGIGDTIRVSLANDRKEEIRVCKTLLKYANRKVEPTLIVCPTCGRTKCDVKEIADHVETFLDSINKDIKVAVMGCPVNGLGEAKDCDIGITGSGNYNEYLLFSKGKELGRFKKEECIKKLEDYIKNF